MTALISPATRPDVLIVGGSLAGLLSAHTLAKAGIRSTVLEKADSHRPSGAALAVDDHQLLEVLGQTRAAAALGRNPRQQNTLLPTTWSQLHRGLLDAATDDPLITVHHNTPVLSVHQTEQRAWVTVRDGTNFVGDAVIGADGYRSTVRREIDPQRPDSTFAGYTLWLGMADEANIPAQQPWPRSLDFRSSGGYYLLGYPLAAEDNTTTPGKRRLGWAWYDATRNDLLRSTGSVHDRTVQRSLRPDQIPDQVYNELASEAMRHWPTPWREAILDSITRRSVVCTPISEYVPERLSRGRFAIVGDAAHVPTPMTGMGFATAVDDAGALAAALKKSTARTVSLALERYANERLAPAQQLVRSGQRFSRDFAA